MSIGDLKRARRNLLEAEGYLELHLPNLALEALARIDKPGELRGHHGLLTGLALRELARYAEALPHLNVAAESIPDSEDIPLARAWCLKRLGRLDLAIDEMRRLIENSPDSAIGHYNLACYASLSGEKELALASLRKAFELDAEFREKVDAETDFDPLRGDAKFQALLRVPA